MRSPSPCQETDPPPRQPVPDAQVRAEFGISAMTLHRWDNDETLQFPRPVVIRGRKYRLRHELEAFKTRLISETAKPYTPSHPTPRRAKAVGGFVTG